MRGLQGPATSGDLVCPRPAPCRLRSEAETSRETRPESRRSRQSRRGWGLGCVYSLHPVLEGGGQRRGEGDPRRGAGGRPLLCWAVSEALLGRPQAAHGACSSCPGLCRGRVGPRSPHRPPLRPRSACGSVGVALAVLGLVGRAEVAPPGKGFLLPQGDLATRAGKFWRSVGTETLTKAWGSPPGTSLGHVFVGSSLEIRKPA